MMNSLASIFFKVRRKKYAILWFFKRTRDTFGDSNGDFSSISKFPLVRNCHIFDIHYITIR